MGGACGLVTIYTKSTYLPFREELMCIATGIMFSRGIRAEKEAVCIWAARVRIYSSRYGTL